MHRITLLVVGKLKESWARDAAALYTDRLKHAVDLRVLELPPSKRSDALGQSEEECARLLAAVEKCTGEVCVLDEQGKDWSSKDWAACLRRLRDSGTPLTVVLGGAYGLHETLRSRADHVVAFGRITLPHELCRIVALEQLYRAEQILKGTGYHH